MNRTRCLLGAWLWCLLAATGCEDEGPSGSLPGGGDKRVLSRVDAAGPADCEHGGSVVSSGADADGDGTLGDGEVAGRQVVCRDAAPPGPAPAPAAPLLSQASREPAGGRCPLGGTAVRSGRDVDGDGALDESEVESTSYVCDVALLSRMRAEPPGPHCADGGIAFAVGHDADGDGELGGGEVASTEYECSGVLSRDVHAVDAADVALLAGVRVVTGSLTIGGGQTGGAGLAEASLPALQLVGAALVIAGGLQDGLRVAAPALTSVGGALRASHVDALELPALRGVGGELELSSTGLGDLGGLAKLERVGGDLRLRNNARLLAAELPGLAAVGGEVAVDGNGALTEFGCSLAEGPAAFDVEHNPALARLSLRTQASEGSKCALGRAVIARNDALTSASVTARCVGEEAYDNGYREGLRVEGNGALDALDLAVGRAVGSVIVKGPALRALTIREEFYGGEHATLARVLVDAPLETLALGVRHVDFGALDLRGTNLTSFGTTADSTVTVANDAAIGDNPKLEQIAFSWRLNGPSRLDVHDNDALQTVAITNQDSMLDGDLRFAFNPQLREATFLQPPTSVTGSIVVWECGLVRFGWPELKVLGGTLALWTLPALQGLDFDNLRRVESGLSILETGLSAWPGLAKLEHAGGLTVERNAALQDIGLGALEWVAGTVRVKQNAALHALGLAALQGAPMLEFVDNQALAVCEIEELFRHVAGETHQEGNDQGGTCP